MLAASEHAWTLEFCRVPEMTYHLVGRQHGEFRRVIPLDNSVDADKVQAEYKDGVLHLTVPKSDAYKPRRIEVQS
jgi:HSP20 family protein